LLVMLIDGVALVSRIPFAMMDVPIFSEWMVLIYYALLAWIIMVSRKSRLEQVSA